MWHSLIKAQTKPAYSWFLLGTQPSRFSYFTDLVGQREREREREREERERETERWEQREMWERIERERKRDEREERERERERRERERGWSPYHYSCGWGQAALRVYRERPCTLLPNQSPAPPAWWHYLRRNSGCHGDWVRVVENGNAQWLMDWRERMAWENLKKRKPL